MTSAPSRPQVFLFLVSICRSHSTHHLGNHQNFPWVAQSVEHLTPGSGPGHDPGAVRSSPTRGPMPGVESASDSLSLSPAVYALFL